MWQGPGGSELPIVRDRAAVGDQLFISSVQHTAVVLHRGPTHYSPDGEHCCVRVAGGPAQSKCVIFSECMLTIICPITNLHPPQLPAPH